MGTATPKHDEILIGGMNMSTRRSLYETIRGPCATRVRALAFAAVSQSAVSDIQHRPITLRSNTQIAWSWSPKWRRTCVEISREKDNGSCFAVIGPSLTLQSKSNMVRLKWRVIVLQYHKMSASLEYLTNFQFGKSIVKHFSHVLCHQGMEASPKPVQCFIGTH